MTVPTQPLAECYSLHLTLVDKATWLSMHLARERADDADLLRLGATCVRIGAQQALATRDPREAIKGWAQCELGERQIRAATSRALAAQKIDNRIYDAVFRAASHATRSRGGELLRMRTELRQLAVI